MKIKERGKWDILCNFSAGQTFLYNKDYYMIVSGETIKTDIITAVRLCDGRLIDIDYDKEVIIVNGTFSVE